MEDFRGLEDEKIPEDEEDDKEEEAFREDTVSDVEEGSNDEEDDAESFGISFFSTGSLSLSFRVFSSPPPPPKPEDGALLLLWVCLLGGVLRDSLLSLTVSLWLPLAPLTLPLLL